MEGIVQAKLKAEKKKEAAKRVARERAEKREEEEAFSKKLGRLLGEQKAVEEAKVKAAQKAQKEAEDRAAAERSRSKASSSSPVGPAAELEKDKAVVESASKTVSSEAKSANSSNFKIFCSPKVTSIPGVKPFKLINESSKPKSFIL